MKIALVHERLDLKRGTERDLFETAVGRELLDGSLLEGIIEQPENPAEVANKVLALLEKSTHPTLRHQARQIGETYSWENHFREFDAILLDLCGGRLAVGVS